MYSLESLKYINVGDTAPIDLILLKSCSYDIPLFSINNANSLRVRKLYL